MGWKNIVGSVAPTIGQALGGPLGGMAMTAICEALGLPSSATDKDIDKALAASPEHLVKLKEAELTFSARMKELDIDLERLHANDRDSARKREQGVGGFAAPTLAGVVVVGFFAVVGYMLSGKVNLTGEQGVIIGSLLGYVSAKADQVVSYYFGSSSSSAHKNEIIARAGK